MNDFFRSKENDRNITQTFSIENEKRKEMDRALFAVYNALTQKGYDPINQIVGYILSEDPTYITNYENARSLIVKIDREELLHAMLVKYLGADESDR